MLSDFQRWLLRSSAKTMRKELTGQVRRTFSGGRQEPGDVWDIATTEIPPEVGEAPECQWCPVCRAARAMRDSGPGIGGQLYGAGDAVASAAADVIGKLDSFLSRAGAGPAQAGRASGREAGNGSGGGMRPGGGATAANGTAAAETPEAETPEAETPAAETPAAEAPVAGAWDILADEAPEASDNVTRPAGWEPAAPVTSAAEAAEPDAWSQAVAADVSNGDQESPAGETAHEPDSRG
jgi:hypothetical protein